MDCYFGYFMLDINELFALLLLGAHELFVFVCAWDLLLIVNDLIPLNAESTNKVTEEGIVICVNNEHPLNA